MLEAGGYGILAASEGFYENFGGYVGEIASVEDGRMGNGLSNEGDRLILRDGAGKEIDALSYGDDNTVMDPACRGAGAGHTLERCPSGADSGGAEDFIDNGAPTPGYGLDVCPTATPTLAATFTPTVTPSPEAASESGSPSDLAASQVVSIDEARRAAEGTKVVLRAQVTSPSYLLGVRIIYVQDATAGLRVYIQHGDYPSLDLGDWTLLTGVMVERQGERQIHVYAAYDVIVLNPDSPHAPVLAKTKDVGEENEGWLVQVRGLIETKSGDYLYVNDGSGTARVYIRDATGIDKSSFSKGDSVEIVGIVSQWDTEAPYDEGYRLMPRYQGDLQIIPVQTEVLAFLGGPQELPKTGDTLSLGVLLAGVATLLAMGFWLRERC